jgi:hypothetical protein
MADLIDKNSALPIKIIGADTLGAETVPAKVSPNQDLGTADVLNNGGLDLVLALTTTPKLGVVNVDGITAKADRKYFLMQALDQNIKWGFTNTTQSFDIFKSQLVMVPCGPNTQIWFKMASGTGSIAIGEVS